MPASAEPAVPGFQSQFHLHWSHLENPHVRTLAWLLDAPDLLDPRARQWQGRIASLGPVDDSTRDWLVGLDRAPEPLIDYLHLQPFTRLGRYAERLMAFYLEHRGDLYAHGVQVRAAKNETIGEFDFLLREGGSLVHWEFATKLYLLEASGHGHHADYFVGPNLADTLGVKVRKIMDRQLSLSLHPAAQQLLPMPIIAAQALVKGWLFYHGKTPEPVVPPGISRAHCRGFWCAFNELNCVTASGYQLLPRLSWLAPAKSADDGILTRPALDAALSAHFSNGGAPALVALMEKQGDYWLETDRGFVVPDDWRSRAESRAGRVG